MRNLSSILVQLILGVALAAPPGAQAQAPDRSTDGLVDKANRGWWFYEDPPKPPPLKEQAIPEPVKEAPKAQAPVDEAKRCANPRTWTAPCGFVDPGHDFEFQAKQRDELLNRMTMSKNDPKAVEDFQYYIRWALGRASEVASLWKYNMVQNPELDPAASHPISALGLRLMSEVKSSRDEEIFRALKSEGALLVFFTRSDCKFCHVSLPGLQRVSKDTGIPLWNAALDDRCMPGLEARCRKGSAVATPAAALQVSIVPTVFLFVAPNTWLRIGTGVTDDQTLKARMVSFFSAYRTALLKGVQNSVNGRPSVDFSQADAATGNSKGVDPGPARLPTDTEINSLLGRQAE